MTGDAGYQCCTRSFLLSSLWMKTQSETVIEQYFFSFQSRSLCNYPLTQVPRTNCYTGDEVAEWLRRWTANPMCSARVGSNPILVVYYLFN